MSVHALSVHRNSAAHRISEAGAVLLFLVQYILWSTQSHMSHMETSRDEAISIACLQTCKYSAHIRQPGTLDQLGQRDHLPPVA